MKVLLNPQTIAALNTKFAVTGIPINVSLIALVLATIEGINIKVYEDGSLEVEATQEVVNKHIEEFFNFLEEKEEPEVYSIENWTFTTIPDQFIELKVLKINASCFTQVAQQVVKVNAVEAVHSYLPHKTIIIPAEDIIEAQNSVICRHKYVPQLLQVFPKLLKAQVLNQCE